MKILTYCSVIFAIFLFTNLTFAQWEKLNGPFLNGSCFAVKIMDSILIAGMDGPDILISYDNGLTWNQRNKNLQGQGVTCIEVADSTIIAGTEFGIYISSDKGNSWTGTNVIDDWIFCVSYYDSVAYAGSSGGPFYSTDKGNTWLHRNNVLTSNSSVNSFAFYDSAVYAATSIGMFRSTDKGMTWMEMNNPPSSQISTITVNDGKIYAGVVGGLYESADNGISWKSVDQGLIQSYITSILLDDPYIFVGTRDAGVYVSSDSGVTWVQTNLHLENPNVVSLAVKDSSIYAATSFGGGVYKSTDKGVSWSRLIMTKRNLSVLSLYMNNYYLFAGTDSAGVFLSTDRGVSWNQRINGVQNSSINCFLFEGSKIYIGTTNGAYISSNNGKGWDGIGLSGSSIQCMLISGYYLYLGTDNYLISTFASSIGWSGSDIRDLDIKAITANSNYVFAGTLGEGVYRSRINEKNWIKTAVGLGNLGVTSLLFDGSKLFAGSLGGGMIVTTDDGDNWIQVNSGLKNKYIYSIASKDPYIFVTTNRGIFCTASDGANWIYAGLETELINSIYTHDSLLYVMTSNGIFRKSIPDLAHLFPSTPFLISPDSDSTIATDSVNLRWSSSDRTVYYRLQLSYNENFTYPFLDTASVIDTSIKVGKLRSDTTYYWRIYAWDSESTGSWSNVGIFKTGKVTGIKENSALPKDYALFQNYPNPFNPATSIDYSVPKTSIVTIKIYDVLGKEVATLLNTEKPAGYYRLKFNANNLTSGIYFYRMQADHFTSTKKLILLK